MRSARLFGSGGAARLVPPGAVTGLSIGTVAAIMAFFAVLVLALALAAGRLAATWSGELAGAATLQVVAPPEAVEDQARAALEVLRTTPGITAVRVIEVDEQRALLAPWFGTDTAIDSLPLPLLIEVGIDRALLDQDELAGRLAAEAPGTVFDDHSAWRAPLIATATRLRLFALASLGLMAVALAAVLSMAATAAVAASGRAIRTLRLVGARDSFIAAGFTRRFARPTMAGAALGTLAGLGLLAMLPATSEQGFFLVGIGPVGWHWLLPALIPPAAGAVAWAVVRLSTGRNLRRWS